MTSDTFDNSIVSPSRNEDIDDVVGPLRDDVKDDVRDGADANNRAIVMDYKSQFTTNEQWASCEDLKSWVTSIGIEHGMVIVVVRSDKGRRVTLQCEKSGKYRESKSRKVGKGRRENTGLKKTGCPFKLVGKVNVEGLWELTVISAVHTHEMVVDLVGHAYVGRLKKEERDLVDGMCDGKSRPKDILVKLKKTFSNNKSTMKTLYNYRTASMIKDRAGRTEMQYITNKVMEAGYSHFYRRCEATNTVTNIFFAHPTSVKLLRAFPGVLLMDCTYKTNRYKYPLLEIVGVTSTGKTFLAACAYLEKEREDNYIWALDRLKSLMNHSCLPNVILTDREIALMNAVGVCFPSAKHLLCRWHINRNIAAKCKKMFRTKEAWNSFIGSWGVLIIAVTEERFFELLRRMDGDFSEYPNALEYIHNQWITPYKERFASPWTNNVLHFGNSTSNRAESQHAVLKKQLATSFGNFETCWSNIHTLLEVSHGEIQASFEHSINVSQHRFKSILFKDLRHVVSSECLSRISAEINVAETEGFEMDKCGCVLRNTCGLPCAHELVKYVKEKSPIPLQLVDRFWRKLDMSESIATEASVIEDLTAHFEDAWAVVKSRFDCANESEKRLLLFRLREIGNPSITTLLTPEGPIATRGRPSKKAKIDTSTKRNKSEFEYATSLDDNSNPMLISSQHSTDAPMFSKLAVTRNPVSSRTRLGKQLGGLRWLPGNMHQYIESEVEIKADGHCGFRTIAAHVRPNEDCWFVVRCDLMQEIKRNEALWHSIFDDTVIAKTTDALHCFKPTAGFKYWFESTDMCPLVANCYNVAVVVLSKAQCHTFLPFSKEIPADPKFIVMGYVNENHFLKVIMREGYPLPTIDPRWRKHRLDCAQGWEDAYKTRFEAYHVTKSSTSVTRPKKEK